MTPTTNPVTAAPIVHLTVFKSGTEMFRKIITDMTGLPFEEPPLVRGKVNYKDVNQLYHKPGHFYSWHLYPTPEVRRKIKEMAAKPVLLIRNIYDLPVSMYHHFAKNIDADIGMGRDVDHYFREVDHPTGLAMIINGFIKPDFIWPGLGTHLQHIQMLLELARDYPSFLTSYDRLLLHKARELKALATFLDLPISENRLATIVEESSFGAMKAKADALNMGSHFRKGRVNSHAEELSGEHIRMIHQVIDREAPDLPAIAKAAGFEEILTTTLHP
ncbi:MAG: sulfotransferase domain-containing protein [Magnetococcales bacterium]|nr:sulfotransferase domain-containing protein [Magnetococcales bacterium]